MRLFGKIETASFISRPNRFTVICRLEGKSVKAYLPNPGRLHELLLPGATLYLEKSDNPGRKMPLTLVAVESDCYIVPLHTHRTNDIAEYLIRKGLVPGLEGAEIIKREVTVGSSRFDFLLKRGSERIILEVKSCTLFSRYAAMFPDAITARGRRHVEELSALTKGDTRGHVLFVVNRPDVKYFLPDFHTDLEFSRTLLAVKDRLAITPVAIGITEGLYVRPKVRVLDIPWDIVKKEAVDGGSYLIVLRLPREKTIEVGGLGAIKFKKGFYVYVGSARKNLSKRIERHRRERKRFRWHIDYLREKAEFLHDLPMRTRDDIECAVAGALRNTAGWEIPGFGSSDCPCPTHLFGFEEDPLSAKKFHELLLYFRVDRFFEGNFLKKVPLKLSSKTFR